MVVEGLVFLVSILAAGRELRVVGRSRLPGRCQASMAVAFGRLFVRTDTEPYAIGR